MTETASGVSDWYGADGGGPATAGIKKNTSQRHQQHWTRGVTRIVLRRSVVLINLLWIQRLPQCNVDSNFCF